jgi:hypothetical protein
VIGGRLDGYVPPFSSREMAQSLRVLRAGRRPAGGPSPAASTTSRAPRRCWACGVITPARELRERREEALAPGRVRAARARVSRRTARPIR